MILLLLLATNKKLYNHLKKEQKKGRMSMEAHRDRGRLRQRGRKREMEGERENGQYAQLRGMKRQA